MELPNLVENLYEISKWLWESEKRFPIIRWQPKIHIDALFFYEENNIIERNIHADSRTHIQTFNLPDKQSITHFLSKIDWILWHPCRLRISNAIIKRHSFLWFRILDSENKPLHREHVATPAIQTMRFYDTTSNNYSKKQFWPRRAAIYCHKIHFMITSHMVI